MLTACASGLLRDEAAQAAVAADDAAERPTRPRRCAPSSRRGHRRDGLRPLRPRARDGRAERRTIVLERRRSRAPRRARGRARWAPDRRRPRNRDYVAGASSSTGSPRTSPRSASTRRRPAASWSRSREKGAVLEAAFAAAGALARAHRPGVEGTGLALALMEAGTTRCRPGALRLSPETFLLLSTWRSPRSSSSSCRARRCGSPGRASAARTGRAAGAHSCPRRTTTPRRVRRTAAWASSSAWSRSRRRSARLASRAAALAPLGACALPLIVLAQGILGGITVLVELHPLIVMAHFLLSLVAIGVARRRRPRRVRFVRGGRASAARGTGWRRPRPLALALVVSGTFVTAAGPHSGGEQIRRYGLAGRAASPRAGVRRSSASHSWARRLALAPRRSARRRRARPRRARRPARADGRRRDPVAQAAALVARARPRRARHRHLGRGRRPCGAPSRSRPRTALDSFHRQSPAHRPPPDPSPRRYSSPPSGAGTTARRAPRWRRATSRRPGRPALRGHRPGGVLRLPGDAAARRARGGMTRRIDWPERPSTTPDSRDRPRRGAPARRRAEPALAHVRDEIVELAQELGVELVVTLGALLADVPHTRPAPVTGSATDPKLVQELGLAASRYEGPTGIVGVLHDACRRPDLRPRASGPPCRTTPRSPRARRRRSRSATGSPTSSARSSTSASSSAPRPPTSSR